jgi:hypothetical protein
MSSPDLAPPICSGCTHLHSDLIDATCTAFPDGIPWDILLSKADHRQLFPGDHNLQFEPKSAEDEAYADMLFPAK